MQHCTSSVQQWSSAPQQRISCAPTVQQCTNSAALRTNRAPVVQPSSAAVVQPSSAASPASASICGRENSLVEARTPTYRDTALDLIRGFVTNMTSPILGTFTIYKSICISMYCYTLLVYIVFPDCLSMLHGVLSFEEKAAPLPRCLSLPSPQYITWQP